MSITLTGIPAENENKMKNKSAQNLPDNPTASGLKASDIKKALTAPMFDESNSLLAFMKTLINDLDTALNGLDELSHSHDNATTLEDITEAFTTELKQVYDTAVANLATVTESLTTHKTDPNAHEDTIGQLISEHNAGAGTHTVAINGKISAHNLSASAHADLRSYISQCIANAEIDNTTGVITLTKKDGSTITIDLPLEKMVASGRYDDINKKIILTLEDETEIEIPAVDLVDEYLGDGETIEKYTNSEGEKRFRLKPSYKTSLDALFEKPVTDLSGTYDSIEEALSEVTDNGIYRLNIDSYGFTYMAIVTGSPRNPLYATVLDGECIGDVYLYAKIDDEWIQDEMCPISIPFMESTQNKTTSISSSSTNVEYPSAKAVYDELIKRPIFDLQGNFSDVVPALDEIAETGIYRFTVSGVLCIAIVTGHGISIPKQAFVFDGECASDIYLYTKTNDEWAQYGEAVHISSCESTTHKATSITEQSTDSQYPSAKCVYDSIQAVKQPKRVYIIGDSISSFDGWMTPSTNSTFYNLNGTNVPSVLQVNQTWWAKVIAAKKWQLVCNNSYSGARVANISTESSNKNSFVKRIESIDMYNPDVTFILGGANDCNQSVPVGTSNWDAWDAGNFSEAELKTFYGAFAYVVKKAVSASKKVYNIQLGSVKHPETLAGSYVINLYYRPVMADVCAHFNVQNIELASIWRSPEDGNIHPSDIGMELMSTAILSAINEI